MHQKTDKKSERMWSNFCFWTSRLLNSLSGTDQGLHDAKFNQLFRLYFAPAKKCWENFYQIYFQILTFRNKFDLNNF